MRLSDFFPPLLMSASAARNATPGTPSAPIPGVRDEAANLNFASSVWTLAQDTATQTAPGGRLQTSLHLDVVPAAPNATFPIYAKRTLNADGRQRFQGLYIRPSFFQFPLPVQLGLIWGMGAAARDERYLSGETLINEQTYGQNARGFRAPSQPTADISRAFGQEIAHQVEAAWATHLQANNLEIPRYPEDIVPVRGTSADGDVLPSYAQAVSGS